MKGKGEEEDKPNGRQSFREQQGDRSRPLSRDSAKKWRKTVEWERLESSSKKLEISWEHFREDERNKGQMQ